MTEFHFIRPYWLLLSIPLIFFIGWLWRQSPAAKSWEAVCDSHLLPHLLYNRAKNKRFLPLGLLFISGLFLIFSLAGPSWVRLPVPIYQTIQPRVVILDMSDNMQIEDLAPDRLSRAKFKLHDLFQMKNIGQMGLVVYSGEAFEVSPLTDDAKTIDALLSDLTPEIMPVTGNRLDIALQEAQTLIEQAGFEQGEVLVMTGAAPDSQAIIEVKKLADKGTQVSVMPVVSEVYPSAFQSFAKAGRGKVIPYKDTTSDIEYWVKNSQHQRFSLSQHADIPVWRDEGRWFIFPALVFLLPIFRRGWAKRVVL